MNDLERDLKELFERRAAGADAPGLPPRDVLRRGRRRQVGTVVIGALACLVALGVAAAAIGQARHPAVIPGGNGLPARSTTIGGVPVTAPAGWTLVDDWPLAAILPTTSQTCSFSTTGTAIDGNGSPVDGVPSVSPIDGGSGEGSSTGQSCSTQNLGYPAGVPVLQLANFEIPPMETVCGLSDQGASAALPNDGVAVYVGAFPGGVSTQALTDSCPGADNVTSGLVVETFADRGVQTAYAAVVVAGAGASSDAMAVAQDYARSLGGLRIDPTAPASSQGPGYVLAAGKGGNASWRLEAGITSFDHRDGMPTVGAVMVTTDPSGEGSRTVELAGDQPVKDDFVDLGTAGVVQFGTATSTVSGVDVVDASGNAERATMLAWPAELGSLPGVRGTSDGWLWYASAAERGTVRPIVASAPTAVPTPTPPSDDTAHVGNKLQTRTDNNGNLVVYGHDLGHDWEIRRIDNSFELFLDGSTTSFEGSLSATLGGSTQVDVGGGSLVIGLEDQTVQGFDVTTDATGQAPSTTIVGRSTPMQDSLGEQGRLWVLALPGSGTGLESLNDDLPSFVSWPSQPLRDGSVIAGGSDGTVSWALRWHNDHCFMLVTLGADQGDTGASQCLPPWRDGSPPSIGGVYGSTRATVTLVVTHRPPTTVHAPGLLKGNLQCEDIDFESNFAGTTICIFSVAVGHTATISLDQNGDPLGGPYTVSANPGSIDISPPGVELQASPEPTP